MRAGGSAFEAFQAFDRAASVYARVRSIFESFMMIGGFDPSSGRAGRVLSEARDPIKAEKFATPHSRQPANPLYVPSLLWPDEPDPIVRAAATRRRFEAFARTNVVPWAPSPAELKVALRDAGVERAPADSQVPAWVGTPGSD